MTRPYGLLRIVTADDIALGYVSKPTPGSQRWRQFRACAWRCSARELLKMGAECAAMKLLCRAALLVFGHDAIPDAMPPAVDDFEECAS